jgi:hypothetical protein
MRQWEYLKLDLNQAPRRGDATDALNNAGSEGWELVTVSGTGMATLKREIAQPTKVGRRKAIAEVVG